MKRLYLMQEAMAMRAESEKLMSESRRVLSEARENQRRCVRATEEMRKRLTELRAESGQEPPKRP